MSEVDLRSEALQWGSIGVVTAGLAVAVAVFRDFPLLLLGMILFGVPLCVVPLALGNTDAGIETAAASTRLGFDAGQAEQYNPGSIPIPGKLQVILWLSGVGVGGFVVMVASA
jgi:hypothetical protein